MCAMRLESCSGFCCVPGAAVEGVVVVPPVVDVVAVVVVVVELVEELVVSVEADAAVVVATVFVVGVDPPIGKDPGFTLHTLYNGDIFKHFFQNFLNLCKFTTTPVCLFKNYTVSMILFYFHPSFHGVINSHQMSSSRTHPGKSEGAVLWRVLSPCCICITAFNAWGLDSKACISGFCSCSNTSTYNC